MSEPDRRGNRVREFRDRLNLSQSALAARAGVSRAAVSAIESGRLAPNVHAAIGIAAALDVSVETLFGRHDDTGAPAWAWPLSSDRRYWQARVGGRSWLYPAEAGPAGTLAHDGTTDGAAPPATADAPAIADGPPTLVVAGCDPAVGLLAAEYAKQTGYRLLPLARSSGSALELLGRGVVHAAGVHLGDNSRAVQSRLGGGHRLLRVARWEAGVAFGAGLAPNAKSVAACRRWVGREPGSGARQCQDELLTGRPAPRRLARDHRGVAEAVRAGWADAGVCTRLTAAETGLSFLPVRRENYDLAFPEPLAADPLVRALVEVVRSARFRRLLSDLPGYDAKDTGECRA
jgi:molybdate-binding protein/transcriptional regulator with XRE-family HTH domain